jgi:hypothetical protein
MRWAQVQPNFEDLVLTVHSTFTNHKLRDRFRRDFRIDCVLFHPDQEAELHTDRSEHVWMLVNYPAEYMAAVLTSVRDDKDKLALYLNECRRMGITVLPPDANESAANFTAVGADIRFGLATD